MDAVRCVQWSPSGHIRCRTPTSVTRDQSGRPARQGRASPRGTASLGSSLGPRRMERSYSSEGTRTDPCCPCMTAVDRCLGHVQGTAGETEHARAWRRWHHLGGRVRPVLGDACLVGKGRWPAAAVRWIRTRPRWPHGPGSWTCPREGVNQARSCREARKGYRS
jgi:hypothetical protein